MVWEQTVTTYCVYCLAAGLFAPDACQDPSGVSSTSDALLLPLLLSHVSCPQFEYAWAYKFRSLIADSFPREFFETALEFGQYSGECAHPCGYRGESKTTNTHKFSLCTCCCLCATGSEVEFQALTGAVSRVPKDAAASGHLRTGNFLVALRGAKEPKNNRVGSDSGEQLPERVTACPGNSLEVRDLSANERAGFLS